MMGWRRFLAVSCALAALLPASADAAPPLPGTYVGETSRGLPVAIALERDGRITYRITTRARCVNPVITLYPGTVESSSPRGPSAFPPARLVGRRFKLSFVADFTGAGAGPSFDRVTLTGRFSDSKTVQGTWRNRSTSSDEERPDDVRSCDTGSVKFTARRVVPIRPGRPESGEYRGENVTYLSAEPMIDLPASFSLRGGYLSYALGWEATCRAADGRNALRFFATRSGPPGVNNPGDRPYSFPRVRVDPRTGKFAARIHRRFALPHGARDTYAISISGSVNGSRIRGAWSVERTYEDAQLASDSAICTSPRKRFNARRLA